MHGKSDAFFCVKRDLHLMQNAENVKNFVKGINSQNISGNQIFDPLQTEEPTPFFSLSNCLLERESATIVRERLFFLLF